MNLEGKVSLVTGAGKGVGKAIALRLAAASATVVVNDIEAASAAACAEEICTRGGRAVATAADVSNPEQVERMFTELRARNGGLDVLVNNAAISRPCAIEDTTDELWRQVLSVNLNGVFYCCRAAFSLMRAGGGCIVNLSSVSAFTGRVLNSNASYVASKAAVDGLTRALASEGIARNISVNSVAPGIVETEIHSHMDKDQRKLLPDLVPLGRLAAPAEVAELVCFLASPAGRYITGQTIHFNGGMYFG